MCCGQKRTVLRNSQTQWTTPSVQQYGSGNSEAEAARSHTDGTDNAENIATAGRKPADSKYPGPGRDGDLNVLFDQRALYGEVADSCARHG
jgi:hypothetical protein